MIKLINCCMKCLSFLGLKCVKEI